MSLADDLKLAGLIGPARALAEEACRIKARLDRLELLITGEDAAWFELREAAGDLEVTVNKPLAEARAQALALRAVLAEFRAFQGVKDESGRTPAPDAADDLAKKREDKRLAAGQA